VDGAVTLIRKDTSKQDILKMAKNMLTNKKETNRAIRAAVNQANKVKEPAITATYCARCNCTPKPDEWGNLKLHYCIDCA
jgi:hypothetical protein